MRDRDKWILLSFLIALFVFSALFATKKIADPDFWWHLKTGEWIWHHKAIPHVDPFSYTFGGVEWVNYEWLFHALIYPIYRLSGFEGLIVSVIIFALLTFAVLFFACREVEGGRRWVTLLILFLALMAVQGRFSIRPQMISYFLLAFYLFLLILYRKERITTRQLIIFLIPTHIFWVNVHGGFFLGGLVVGAYTLGRFAPLALRHRRDLSPVFRDKRLQGLLLVCLLLAMASLVNPYTYRIFSIPLKTAGSETLQGITEWLGIDIRFIGIFAIEYTMWFRILFLTGAISFLIWRDNLKRIEDVVIFALLSYMAFKHVRFTGEFAIVAAPIIVDNLASLRWRVRGWRWARLVPLVAIILFSFYEARNLVRMDRIGLGVGRNYPAGTVRFLKEHQIKGNLFNTYGHGGYLIWHLWPDIPVFIDGRTPTIYDDDFFWLYGLAARDKDIWEKVVQNYGIEIVLVWDTREMGYTSLFYWLDEDEGWRLVAFDDESNLYLKRGGRFDGLIERYGFHDLRPADVFMDYAKGKKGDKRYLKALGGGLEEACRRYPDAFYPFYYLGVYHQIYGTADHLQDAEKAFRKAVANRPDLQRGHYELGFTLMKVGRYDEAIEAFKRSMRLGGRLPADIYYYLGASFFHQGEIDKAIRMLEKYKEKAGFETKVEAYKLLGRAYLQRHKLQKALSCFERVGYLEKPTWDTLVNKGVAFFGKGNLDKARESFEQAMEIKPDQLKVVYNLAVVYEKLGLQDEARRLFVKATQLRPQNAEEEIWLKRAREKTR